MVQFNLRIPVEMEQEFEAYKGKFNVSSVCQGAIATEIAHQKRLEKALTARQQTIARLRREKEESEDAAFQSGREAGTEEAEDLGYAELVAIGRMIDEYSGEVILSYLEKDIGSNTSDDLYEWLRSSSDLSEDQYNAYIDGWLRGVADFWAEIKEDVEA